MLCCVVWQALNLDVKQTWIRKLRELIQERLMYIGSAFDGTFSQDNVFKPLQQKPFDASRISRYISLRHIALCHMIVVSWR
jgi:hypothetical protein